MVLDRRTIFQPLLCALVEDIGGRTNGRPALQLRQIRRIRLFKRRRMVPLKLHARPFCKKRPKPARLFRAVKAREG